MASRNQPTTLADQGPLERRILSYLCTLPNNGLVNQRQLALRLGELTSTVHYAVARLIQRGYLEPVSVRGRARPVRLCPGRVLAAGLAVHAGFLRVALMNLRGEVVAERSQAQPNEPGLSLPSFADRVQQMIQSAVQGCGERIGNLSAVCVAVDGQVDEQTGMIIECGTFDWQDVPLGAALLNRLRCPVTVMGSSSLAEAVSEAVAGVGRGFDCLVYYRIDDGISARLVRHGQIFPGAFGYAGELGHIAVAQAEPAEPCGVCGSSWCLQTHASGPALAAEYAHQTRRPPGSTSSLFAALVDDAEAGQKTARKLLNRALDLWTSGIQVALNAYDPPAMALGGWCMRNHPSLTRQLIRQLRQHLLESARRPVHIAPAIVEPTRRDLAAAARAMQSVVDEPAPAGAHNAH